MRIYSNFLKSKTLFAKKNLRNKDDKCSLGHYVCHRAGSGEWMICNNDVWPSSPFSAGAEFHFPVKSADGLRTRTHVHGFICRTRLASNLCVNVRLYCMFAYLFSHPIYSNSAPFHLRGCVCWLGSFFFFFFLPFSGTFSVILGGTRWRGARKRLFCPAAPVKGGCPP